MAKLGPRISQTRILNLDAPTMETQLDLWVEGIFYENVYLLFLILNERKRVLPSVHYGDWT
jgi:hypothetical protein